MIRFKPGLPVVIVLLAFGAGCAYNAREAAPTAGPTCDTTVKYTYDSAFFVMDRRECLGCHYDGGDLPNLDGDSLLRKYIRDNESKFIKSINFEGDHPMPKGGSKMPDADIKILENWICQGMK